MNARETVVAALAPVVDLGWKIIDTARQIDVLTTPTLIVWTSNVERIDKNNLDWLKATTEVWLITPETQHDKVEPALDAMLDQVLALIEAADHITWKTADRGTLAETFQGWHIPITTVYQIG